MRSATQRWWLAIIVASALIAVLVELRAQSAPSESVLVLEADQALGAAVRADDKSIARKLLSLQFTFVDANGKIHERKDFLADLKAAAAAPPSDPVVKIYGRIGMVTGHRKSADGRDVFFLDIWAKQKRAWRALVSQEVVLAATDTPRPAPAHPSAAAAPYDCKNPCQTIPYRVRSPAEQDIVNSFQAIEKAAVGHDAAEWCEAHRRRVRALRQRPRADCQIRTHCRDQSPEGEQHRGDGRRGPGHAAVGLRRWRGHDRNPRFAGQFAAAVPSRARVGQAQRPVADGDQRADRYQIDNGLTAAV